VDAAEQGDGKVVEAGIHPRHRGGVFDVFIVRVRDHARHPREIGAGAERFPRSGEHRHADLLVGGHAGSPARQLLDDVFIERVANVGTIERHVLDRPVAADVQELEAHTLHPEDAEAWRRDRGVERR
jgi:hypothetical protein